MNIIQVDAEDALALGKVSFDLKDKGLVLLQGENKDDPSANSNGAGKSSLVDVICWALWGSTARGISGDAIIRNGAKSADVAVQIQDEDTGELWLVQRVRKKNKETLKVARCKSKGEWDDHSLGTIKLTQALVAKLLGCSEEVFKAAIYVGQESLVDLPMLTDKALKELIEEAAGVKILEQAYEEARKRVRGVHEALFSLNTTQDAQQDRRQTLIEAHQRELDHKTAWEAQKAAVDVGLSGDLQSIKQEIEKHQAVVDSLSPELPNIEAKITDLDKTLAGFNAEQTEERRLGGELTRSERARDLKAAELKRMATEVQTRKAELVTVEDQVGKPCPECGSAMTADHIDHAKRAAQGRITGALATVASERKAWEALRTAADKAREALDAHRAGMRDPSVVTAERDGLVHQRSVIVEEQRLLKGLLTQLASTTARICDLRASVNPHDLQIAKIKRQIEAGYLELLDRGKEIITLEQQAKHEEFALDVFSPKGVRAHILDEVTPFLNDRTGTYLSTLSDGMITATWSTLQVNAKGEVKERFAIDVTHAHGGKSFPALSGGEKRKVRLACALALQDLVASRATKPFRLWVGDEIDQALDPSGLERLMMVLQEKAKERGTVVVISHSDLRDWISQTWTVVKQDDKSELVI